MVLSNGGGRVERNKYIEIQRPSLFPNSLLGNPKTIAVVTSSRIYSAMLAMLRGSALKLRPANKF